MAKGQLREVAAVKRGKNIATTRALLARKGCGEPFRFKRQQYMFYRHCASDYFSPVAANVLQKTPGSNHDDRLEKVS
jgi:hypothetical protein